MTRWIKELRQREKRCGKRFRQTARILSTQVETSSFTEEGDEVPTDPLSLFFAATCVPLRLTS